MRSKCAWNRLYLVIPEGRIITGRNDNQLWVELHRKQEKKTEDN